MKKTTKLLLLSLALIALLSVIIFMDDGSQIMNILRIVVGSVTLLFVPGRWVTTVTFKKKEIDLLERVALSFAFSISIVPLIVFYANLAGMKITEWLVIGVVLLIVCFGGIIALFRKDSFEEISQAKKLTK